MLAAVAGALQGVWGSECDSLRCLGLLLLACLARLDMEIRRECQHRHFTDSLTSRHAPFVRFAKPVLAACCTPTTRHDRCHSLMVNQGYSVCAAHCGDPRLLLYAQEGKRCVALTHKHDCDCAAFDVSQQCKPPTATAAALRAPAKVWNSQTEHLLWWHWLHLACIKTHTHTHTGAALQGTAIATARMLMFSRHRAALAGTLREGYCHFPAVCVCKCWLLMFSLCIWQC
jgi:hypothetical protein